MRREELYLGDIIEAAEAIGRFLGGVEREAFVDDDLIRIAVQQKLSIIKSTSLKRFHYCDRSSVLPAEMENPDG